ncbi:hypothetical protein PPO43_03310 [Saprospira sp. CCB-QB6]|uniref:hypothetical protein n=1 Tax=Saprospira sp. CCB-QB6 TaxID=3023936 RepID=UPI00234AB32E|nr:hypothetical protein [Saprospira sp. CCB-QB6]WCL82130.1 hypothetical protein PPO43_03310 [Saprospira sp. CCB-QB6]
MLSIVDPICILTIDKMQKLQIPQAIELPKQGFFELPIIEFQLKKKCCKKYKKKKGKRCKKCPEN